jgi:hypothetical protein
MLNPNRILAALFLLALPHSASAASLANTFTPGTPYYFNDFDPIQQPWEPGQHLNIEEVFKNYQYFEIVFDQDGKGITVNRYLRGSKESSEKYLVLPDKSLRKK